MLLIPFSLISVVISCIQEFRDLHFILISGGHHFNFFEVAFLNPFFAPDHTCSTVGFLCNIEPDF
jgi:hypothetical protein